MRDCGILGRDGGACVRRVEGVQVVADLVDGFGFGFGELALSVKGICNISQSCCS